MRLKALDRQLPLAPIVAFVLLGTSAAFFAFLTILMLTTAALSEQADEPAQCLTSRSVFARTMQETNHPLLIAFPEDLSRRFIAAWNRGMVRSNKLFVSPTTDSVVVYDYPRADFLKVAFFKGDCLVEAFDVPTDGFWSIITLADDTKWRI